MRKEPRAAKAGRFLAAEYNIKMAAIPRGYRNEYIARFVNELMNYSFRRVEAKERGIRNSDWELRDLVEPDPFDPMCSAKILKEVHHLFLQINTSYNSTRAFLYHFQDGAFRFVLDRMYHLVSKHRNLKDDAYVYSDYPVGSN